MADERLLGHRAEERQVPVAAAEYPTVDLPAPARRRCGARARLRRRARLRAREDQPADAGVRPLERARRAIGPAGPDLDVVGMGAQGKAADGPVGGQPEPER